MGFRTLAGWALLSLVAVSILDARSAQAEPKRYDPDPQACQPQAIRKTFQANQLPWKDQPEVVQQRLRQLQAAMTLDTLRDCQAKGLMSADQVR